MEILREGDSGKLFTETENEMCCPNCHCTFDFEESNIDFVTTSIKYDKGLKKLFGFNKGVRTRKYITCPWCKTIHKLKYTIDN